MRQVAQAERAAPRLRRLRRAFVGGDRVPADLLAEMRAALPSAETHVLYGPTEATILASAYPVPTDGVVEGHPIGTPLGNVRLYVCDAAGGLQPAGVPGELLIGGAGVARGYLGRAALTAERFVPDPFGGEPGARLYRTGDRVRWRESAKVRECVSAEVGRHELTDALNHSRTPVLEYLGRTDAQVKIRGFRIEPGEIEAALRRGPGVRDCVVIAREDAPGDPRLVAYVVVGAEAEAASGPTPALPHSRTHALPTADALRTHLGRILPEHMMPGAIVMLDALPLSPNGKVDRRALPAPERTAAAASPAPRDEMEARVAGVWRDVLGVDRIGVHDNFFDLGGTSLMLARIHHRLREVRADLRVVDLFRYTTVEALSAWLAAAAPADDALAESRARAGERRAARRRVRG
jgi:acyl-CoA synthetase (AMP-forming)/AMP-acid ligase II/aryl carrier-like protein